MCQFCSEHKRKKWFLDEDNYEEELLKEGDRKNVLQKLSRGTQIYLDDIEHFKRNLDDILMNEHATQIVTLEDALEIIDLSENHVLLPCLCRKATANIEKMCCINFGPMKDLVHPDEKMEEIDAEEVKLRVKDWYAEGLFLEVGYAIAPFPMCLCCCDRNYCLVSKIRHIHGAEKALVKGHEVGIVDSNKCKCETFQCMTKCPFGAMFVDRLNMKAVIDPSKCFGCGLCITGCNNNAISLSPRDKVPAARGKW